MQETLSLVGDIRQHTISGNLGFTVKEIIVDGGPRWLLQFDASTWAENGKRFSIDVQMSVHGLGLFAGVRNIERLVGGNYENVWYAYERCSNGTIVIFADERFAGHLILEGGQ